MIAFTMKMAIDTGPANWYQELKMQNPSLKGRSKWRPFSFAEAIMTLYTEKEGRFYRPDGSKISFTKVSVGAHIGWRPAWMEHDYRDDGRSVAHLRSPSDELSPPPADASFGVWYQPCPRAD